jgi:hypothetical protein
MPRVMKGEIERRRKIMVERTKEVREVLEKP